MFLGICLSSEQNAQCSYSVKCESIISYTHDFGEILIKNSLLLNRESLCFVILAKDKHKIKLIVDRVNFNNQQSGLDLFIYDGDEEENRILVSTNSILSRQIVQTREHHLATIVIRKRQEIISDFNGILLNITWLTSVCPDNQMLCGGRYETKCYSKQQRCDG